MSLSLPPLDRILRRHFERTTLTARVDIGIFRDQHEFRRYADGMTAHRRYRLELERWYGDLASAGPLRIPGTCRCCRQSTRFLLDMIYSNGHEPNLRERLNCEVCGLSNRLRLCLDVFDALNERGHDVATYLTEQGSPTFDELSKRCNLVGSEFVDADLASGTQHGSIRHENLMRLSFEDASFDVVLSFDRLEHVPDARCALREFVRVLRPRGMLVLTAPFDVNAEQNLKRAEVDEAGSVRHLLAPDMHPDPLNAERGLLCYWWFGWQLLTDMLEMGFADAAVVTAWSSESGYLGHWLPIVVATR